MPKKIIYISKPVDGSNFRTMGSGDSHGNSKPISNCVRYTRIISQMILWTNKFIHDRGRPSHGGHGGQPGFSYPKDKNADMLKPMKPTGISAWDVHKCPNLTQVLLGVLDAKLDRMLRSAKTQEQIDFLRRVRSYTNIYRPASLNNAYSQPGSEKSRRLTALQEASLLPAVAFLITVWPVVAPFVFP